MDQHKSSLGYSVKRLCLLTKRRKGWGMEERAIQIRALGGGQYVHRGRY